MKYKLRDVLNKYIRGPFGSALKRGEMKSEGIPVYEQQNAIYDHREFRFFIDDEKFSELKRFQVQTGDLIISCSGTLGKVSIISKDDAKGIISQALLILRPNSDIILPEYLYYFFKSDYGYRSLTSRSSGSVQINLAKREVIEDIDIFVPSKLIQEKIVKVLKNIDNKIKVNNEINNNLSEQIKSIYNEIFTEFIDYKRLDEISNVTIGKTPPRSEQECFTTDKNDVKWISISDLGKSGMFIFDTSEKLTQEAVDKYNVKVIPKDTVILSFKLTVGRTGFTTEDMTTNEAIAHFDLNNKELNNYLYCTLTYYNYSDLGSTSSIATAINSKIVKSIKIGIPSDEQLNKFNNLTSAMFKTIKNNESENIKLSELRDTLLPKLMNGEIDLDKIEL